MLDGTGTLWAGGSVAIHSAPADPRICVVESERTNGNSSVLIDALTHGRIDVEIL